MQFFLPPPFSKPIRRPSAFNHLNTPLPPSNLKTNSSLPIPFCIFLPTIFLTTLFSCSKPPTQELLPSSKLGNPGGKTIQRVITHYHSPLSFDACDKKGIQNGQINQDCMQNLRDALCQNQVDLLFLSDHPDHMQSYEMPNLSLIQGADLALMENDQVIGNQMQGCSNGAKPVILPGFEGRLLALGLKRHLTDSIEDRTLLYQKEDPQIRADLASTAEALVFIPHTESRSLELIQSLAPDGIEIYNIHANVDPKIRKRDLNTAPFEHFSGILTYLVDPYQALNADYMFLHFFEIPETNVTKWNTLIGSGMKITGIPGTDSHENVFPQKASDGERIDSHRRLTKFVSNHILVDNPSPEQTKAALKKGASWIVFEGFATPQDMDFWVECQNGVQFRPGDTFSLDSHCTAFVNVPTLATDGSHKAPLITQTTLYQVDLKGNAQILSQGTGSQVSAPILMPGAGVRAQINITPQHLSAFLGDFESLSRKSFPWIITNHVYQTP